MGAFLYMALKMEKVYKILLIILFFILLSSDVYAINFGAFVKDKTSTIIVGESKKLTAIFWNSADEPYKVILTIDESPNDWIVVLDPSEFILNKTIGEEYISLPYTEEIIKAKVVNLFVKADGNSKSGKYYITIRAESVPFTNNGNLNVISERLFRFEINLDAMSYNNDNVNHNDDVNWNLKLSNNDRDTESFYFNPFTMLLIFLILIIIYKKIE